MVKEGRVEDRMKSEREGGPVDHGRGLYSVGLYSQESERTLRV